MSITVRRIVGKTHRFMATRFATRTIPVRLAKPIVSFTFDDAPASAFTQATPVLEAHGARATFYLSLGLLGQDSDSGLIADLAHLKRAHAAGHELGCHTFDHLDAADVSRERYLASVDANRSAIARLLPSATFETFAYPKGGARVLVKRLLGERFLCCRGGREDANIGAVDLNLVKACFLDQRAGLDFPAIAALLDRNARARGWLVFATHDLSNQPSRYGCSPARFRQVVEMTRATGATILPMAEACRRLIGG